MCWFRAQPVGGQIMNGLFAHARGFNSTRGGAVAYGSQAFTVLRRKDDLRYFDVRYALNGNTLSEWHHLALVDTDTEWCAYSDGGVVQSGTRSLGSSEWTGWEDYPWRTSWVDGGLGNASGELQISNIRMFQGGLTQTEIQTAME